MTAFFLKKAKQNGVVIMDIRISGAIEESIVDGPGVRYVVFTQGCPHHCEGCQNPETHDFGGGIVIDTEGILKEFRANPLLGGITFSGGEPFCQPEPLCEIAKEVHSLGKSVWSFSGYTFEEILKLGEKQVELLKNLDVLVDGKFLLAEKSLNLRFRGSKNQRLIDVKKSLEKEEVVLWEED